MKDMSERVAIVTGASSGIGAAIARKFADAGIKTVLAARSADKLDAIAAEIARKGGTALACPTDVTAEPQVLRLFESTMAAYGRVDILVNNAGLADHVPTVDLSLADWQRSIDTMLTGPFLCGREAMRVMVKQKRGRIINIGSVSSRRPRPHTIGYAAAKFGLHGITQSMALDGREHGITVSIIDPGSDREPSRGRRVAAEAAAHADDAGRGDRRDRAADGAVARRDQFDGSLRPADRHAVLGPGVILQRAGSNISKCVPFASGSQ